MKNHVATAGLVLAMLALNLAWFWAGWHFGYRRGYGLGQYDQRQDIIHELDALELRDWDQIVAPK